MKEIQAFIRPHKLIHLYDALKNEGYNSLTVLSGEGTGKYTDPEKAWPSLKFPYLHGPVVKLEMVCKDDVADKIVDIILTHGSTGQKGDGLIYISHVEEVIRIKDGAKGDGILV